MESQSYIQYLTKCFHILTQVKVILLLLKHIHLPNGIEKEFIGESNVNVWEEKTETKLN